MRRALAGRLEEKQVGLSCLSSGVYMPNYHDFIVLKDSQKQEKVELLDARELAGAVSAKLLDRQTCVSLREFV